MDRVNYYNGMPRDPADENTAQEHAEAHLQSLGRAVAPGTVTTGGGVTVGAGPSAAVTGGEAIGPDGERIPISATTVPLNAPDSGHQWVTITVRHASVPAGAAYQDILGNPVRQYTRDGSMVNAVYGAAATTADAAMVPDVPATDVVLADVLLPAGTVSLGRRASNSGGLSSALAAVRAAVDGARPEPMAARAQVFPTEILVDIGDYSMALASTADGAVLFTPADLASSYLDEAVAYANGRLYYAQGAGFSTWTEIPVIGLPRPDGPVGMLVEDWRVVVIRGSTSLGAAARVEIVDDAGAWPGRSLSVVNYGSGGDVSGLRALGVAASSDGDLRVVAAGSDGQAAMYNVSSSGGVWSNRVVLTGVTEVTGLGLATEVRGALAGTTYMAASKGAAGVFIYRLNLDTGAVSEVGATGLLNKDNLALLLQGGSAAGRMLLFADGDAFSLDAGASPPTATAVSITGAPSSEGFGAGRVVRRGVGLPGGRVYRRADDPLSRLRIAGVAKGRAQDVRFLVWR